MHTIVFLAVGADFIVALAAIYRSAAPGFEGYLGIPAAFGTGYREHFPLSGSVAAGITAG